MIIQIAIIAFALFAIWRAFIKFRAREISVAWFIFWTVFWLGVCIVVLLPRATEMAAAWFGVGRGVDLVIYISIVVLFYLIFKIFLKTQNLERDISKVVQELAVQKPKEPKEKEDASK
jgi:hypothetical protein